MISDLQSNGLRQSTMIWKCKLNEPELNKTLIKIIDQRGDEQAHSTNIKAYMTSYKMQSEMGFKELQDRVLDIIRIITLQIYKQVTQYTCSDMWGAKYKSGEGAIIHHHWPSTWSFVYYLTAPKNAPGLFFPDSNEEIEIEPGLLLVFKGDVAHGVKPTEFEGYRYIVAGNYLVKEAYE